MQVQKDKDDWQERMGTIRQLQDEEGNIPATITSWNITDNEKYVEVEYRIDPFEEVHTEQFEAPDITNDDTILEEFLDELGYDISTTHLIETEQPEFEVSSTEDGNWSIKDMIETNRDEELSQRYEPPGWATSKEDKFGYGTFALGLSFGIILFPVIMGLLYTNDLNKGFTHKSIALSVISSFINAVFVVSTIVGVIF